MLTNLVYIVEKFKQSNIHLFFCHFLQQKKIKPHWFYSRYCCYRHTFNEQTKMLCPKKVVNGPKDCKKFDLKCKTKRTERTQVQCCSKDISETTDVWRWKFTAQLCRWQHMSLISTPTPSHTLHPPCLVDIMPQLFRYEDKKLPRK